MTHAEFRAALTRLDLSQTAFAAQVGAIGGERLPLRTVQGWATGTRAIPPAVPALLAMMGQPKAGRG